MGYKRRTAAQLAAHQSMIVGAFPNSPNSAELKQQRREAAALRRRLHLIQERAEALGLAHV